MNGKWVDQARAGILPVAVSITTISVLVLLLMVESVTGTMQSRKSRTSKRQTTEDLFRTNCARCHGADGRGDTPLGQQYVAPDFTNVEWWRKNSETTTSKSLRNSINNGKGKMPAFAKKLKRSEIDLLVKFVKHFKQYHAPIGR